MSTTPLPPPDRRVKVAHLVLGLLFLGLATLWALGESDLIAGERLAVLGPAVLVLAGVVGLVGTFVNARRRTHLPDTGYDTTEELR